MSRHHIATHVYDYRAGWVRIPRALMNHARAEELRDEGFTLVRSRRGLFGSRELPVTWYLRRPSAEGTELPEPGAPPPVDGA